MKLPPESFHRKTGVSLPFADRYLAIDPVQKKYVEQDLKVAFRKPRLHINVVKQKPTSN